MKVLFVDGTPGHNPKAPNDQPQGGILTSLTKIPEYLVKKGHEVWVKGSYEKNETINGVHYIASDEAIPKWDVTVFNRNMIDKDFVLYCKKAGIKCLWWLHDIVDVRYLTDDAYKYFDHVVALSEYCKDSYTEFYNLKPDRITIIPNGVDKSIFYPGKYEDKNPHLTVMASALIKGYGAVPLTWQTLKQHDKKAELRIYSSQKLHGFENSEMDKRFLVTMIQEGADVRQPVPQPILAEILRKSWLFLMPNSYPEICSNLLLQARACGTPVIMSDIGSAREFIKDGETGVITKHNPHDYFLWYKAYAQAAAKTVHNKEMHKHISENAPKGVLSWDEVGEKWDELLAKI